MADRDPNQERRDPNVEVPGDTNSADIVGPTGEQMPQQSHDGVETDARTGHAVADVDVDEDNDKTGHPI